MSVPSKYLPWSAATVAVALAGCGAPDVRSHIQRSDSSGIEIVTHVGPDTPLAWSFDTLFTLGGEETDEESFYEVDPTTVGVDNQGRIYVLDRDAYRVLMFDAEGRHLRTLGREGGGPGEMRFPFGLFVSPDGTVGAFDISKRGFVRFGPDGSILPEEYLPSGYGGGKIRRVGQSLVFSADELDTDRGIHIDQLVTIGVSDTAAMVHLERPAGGVLNLESCGMQLVGIGPIFRPSIRWTPLGSAVAVAVTAEYEITVYRDGIPVRVLRRSVAPVPATLELAAERVGDGMKVMTTGGVRTCDAREVVEQRGVADVIPIVADLAAGPDGTLWIRRAGRPGAPRPIDVFDADGSYLGTLPDASPFPIAVFGSRLIVIEADDMDVERLVIYEVLRGRP